MKLKQYIELNQHLNNYIVKEYLQSKQTIVLKLEEGKK